MSKDAITRGIWETLDMMAKNHIDVSNGLLAISKEQQKEIEDLQEEMFKLLKVIDRQQKEIELLKKVIGASKGQQQRGEPYNANQYRPPNRK